MLQNVPITEQGLQTVMIKTSLQYQKKDKKKHPEMECFFKAI